MNFIYIILAFAVGFVFGIIATSLAVISGDKKHREK